MIACYAWRHVSDDDRLVGLACGGLRPGRGSTCLYQQIDHASTSVMATNQSGPRREAPCSLSSPAVPAVTPSSFFLFFWCFVEDWHVRCNSIIIALYNGITIALYNGYAHIIIIASCFVGDTSAPLPHHHISNNGMPGIIALSVVIMFGWGYSPHLNNNK